MRHRTYLIKRPRTNVTRACARSVNRIHKRHDRTAASPVRNRSPRALPRPGRGSARPRPGAAYNLCDDEAAPPQEVVAFACALLGREAPPLVPFEAAELSDMARSFYRDNKRVSNARIKDKLGVKLVYPTYREGLPAILAGMDET